MAAPANKRSECESISVFFPCYNEQGNIRRIYESASEVLKKTGLDFEIILVDDGSTDETPVIANAIAVADPRVKVVHHPKNLGYGSALQSVFRAATKSFGLYGLFGFFRLHPVLCPVFAYPWWINLY